MRVFLYNLNSDLIIYQTAFSSKRTGIAQGVSQSPVRCHIRSQDITATDTDYYNLFDNRVKFAKKGYYNVIVLYSAVLAFDSTLETSYNSSSSDGENSLPCTHYYKSGSINVKENYVINAPKDSYFAPQICNKNTGWEFSMTVVIRPLFTE